MAQKIQKTNVCRLLDAAGIAYELIEYEVDESDLSASGSCQRQQVLQTDSAEGTAAAHRLYSWRLLPDRNEETIPVVHRRDLSAA